MRKEFSDETEKEIIKLYFQDKLSTSKLAKKFGCVHTTIWRIIQRQGFKPRTISEAQPGRSGKLNSNWRGGRIRASTGYIWILRSDHPNCDRYGYVPEHRLVMEKYLGRYLSPKEIIHHKNNKRDDNRIENLRLFNNSFEHLTWHRLQKKQTELLQADFRKPEV